MKNHQDTVFFFFGVSTYSVMPAIFWLTGINDTTQLNIVSPHYGGIVRIGFELRSCRVRPEPLSLGHQTASRYSLVIWNTVGSIGWLLFMLREFICHFSDLGLYACWLSKSHLSRMRWNFVALLDSVWLQPGYDSYCCLFRCGCFYRLIEAPICTHHTCYQHSHNLHWYRRRFYAPRQMLLLQIHKNKHTANFTKSALERVDGSIELL